MQPILTVNLTTGNTSEVEIPKEWERDYIGGASLAARILYDYLTPDLDPLSPQAPLLFLTGPLSGTGGPAVGRFVIAARSPATGLWGESNCGGFWGYELSRAGYDGLWLTGQAASPVYLWIQDHHVEIRAANHLWGIDTYQTQETIQGELGVGKARVATIGPAGEARVPFALILTDHGRVAGRTGMGAVMGSKNLKAIAVQGHGKVPTPNPELYIPLRSETNRQLREDTQTKVMHELGTASVADYMDYLGIMPKRYYQTDVYEKATNVTGATIAETILAGTSTCHACVIACGRVVRLQDNQKRKGPEYETLMGFGPNLWLDDLAFATRMGELCDRYGMDSISLSNVVGLAFKLYEQGVITEADTGGIALQWGDASAVEKLVRLACDGQGFGAYLKEGARSFACRYGAEGEAVQVNGLEAPYHDPRGGSGMALVYATSPRGACHNQSDYFMVEIGQAEAEVGIEFLTRQGGAEKALNVARHQNWRTLYNALVMCIFANVSPNRVVSLVNVICGEQWSLEDMLRSGERAWNLKRVINIRLGLRKENDRLPKAFMTALPQGGGTGGYVPPFQEMLEAYYFARGWDALDGFPRRGKLEELGLDFVIEELESLRARENLRAACT